MEMLTGGREMDASVIREYFKPLEMWLKADNEKNGEFIGWESGKSDPNCTYTSPHTWDLPVA